ncbi:MAG: glucuronate isomerase, partial [Oscillospiraceae bacterium]|nr:glucuronate isomerase [Oscillospiraceae bacterium]
TQVWLGGDHYKWRRMRSNGVEEKYITGDASDREKFQKWAETLEMAIGNPLYHWSHLELQRYFGYNGWLNGESAEEVWNIANAKLAQPEMSARGLIKQSNVKVVCTTDDPVDSLEWHKKIREDDSFDVQVLPAWRPDKALNIENPDYIEYIAKLGKAADIEIECINCLKNAISKRIDYFHENGCSVSDHGLDFVMYYPADKKEVNAIFKKRLAGEEITTEEALKFKTYLLLFMAEKYREKGWVMQMHFGVRRDLNKKIFAALGPDAGIDSINDNVPVGQMAQFLNALAEKDKLPKTILYSLNPNDNAAIGTIMGAFQDSSCVGKIQHGSAWWFNDNKTGMTEQMTSLANIGLLGNFIGMLTDSRSFLSYTRHEYFRRIMCNLIGTWVENGEYPNDDKVLKKIVEGISYNNTIRYFNF